MNFRSSNRLSILVNMISGTFLPTTNKKTKLSILPIIYSILVWIIELAYLITCILGIFNAPKERILKNSTVSTLVAIEVIGMTMYFHSRKNLIRELIEKLNDLLSVDNEVLRNVTISTVKMLEKPLGFYTIGSTSAAFIWTSMPIIEVFRKDEFCYTDYQLPAVISTQPFSVGVFVAGVVLQMFGGAYTIIRKISLDLYMMHLILLLTAQYKYLRIEFAKILEQEYETLSNVIGVTWQSASFENKTTMQQKLRSLTYHHGTVVEMAVVLKKLLSPHIGLLYVDSVFRFCFLSFMIVTDTKLDFEICILLSYVISALLQFYILCYCIQKLFEVSTAVADDAIHGKWYIYELPIQRVITMISFSNKLECRLSTFRYIDLTLSSFMSILNQAYSVCLLFLKSNS